MKSISKLDKWYAWLAAAGVCLLCAVVTLIEPKEPLLPGDALNLAVFIFLAVFLGVRGVILLRHRDGSGITCAEKRALDVLLVLDALLVVCLVASLIVPGL